MVRVVVHECLRGDSSSVKGRVNGQTALSSAESEAGTPEGGHLRVSDRKLLEGVPNPIVCAGLREVVSSVTRCAFDDFPKGRAHGVDVGVVQIVVTFSTAPR